MRGIDAASPTDDEQNQYETLPVMTNVNEDVKRRSQGLCCMYILLVVEPFNVS